MKYLIYILVCFVGILTLNSCSDVEEGSIEPASINCHMVEKLYRLSSITSEASQGIGWESLNKAEYTRCVTELFFIGVCKNYPGNFAVENLNVSLEDCFLRDDPLGWNSVLAKGAVVVFEEDTSLLVLREKHEGVDPMNGRVIDAIAVSNEMQKFARMEMSEIGEQVLKSAKKGASFFGTRQ